MQMQTVHHTKRRKAKATRLTLTLLFIFPLFFATLPSPEVVATAATAGQAAPAFADPNFEKLWNRTDKLVARGSVARSYLWGAQPSSVGLEEDYAEAPGGTRLVQYFDKSRMEITNPSGDQTSVYYVSNGLIAKEMITGQLQLGDATFEAHSPAEIGVAGDPDDTSGPTYSTLAALLQSTTEDTGNPITKAIDRAGNKRDGTADFDKYHITQANFVPETGHNIAKPFWDYLNQTGPILVVSNSGGNQERGGEREGGGEIGGRAEEPTTGLRTTETTTQGRIFDPVFFATGLPITEAWWARVKVAGEVKDVLVQAFERRILTYTPSNSAAYQVEMGNVGQHYYQWRYLPSTINTTPTPTPTQQPSPTPTEPPTTAKPEPTKPVPAPTSTPLRLPKTTP
ncbi:MAG: hypothetical protein HXX20_13160 [Chloroflexi bacterium]|nr:hypothetical protein [Chloroflexota bacterium]